MAVSITAGSSSASGKQYEPILGELLFTTKTIDKGLVTFAEDVKSSIEFTETSNTVALQAYTAGAPTSSGAMTSTGAVITPTKVMIYQEFNPNTLRASRYGRDMKKGAWNMASSEFEKAVLNVYGNKCAYTTEANFWNGATSATQTAVAALTAGSGQAAVGAEEQTYVASLTAGQIDGIVTRMIYNAAAVGGRYKVAGTTVTSSNIKTEYDKVYSAIGSVVLNQGGERPVIYAPYSHLQLINKYNNVATNYKDVFITTGLGTPNQTVTFYGLDVQFVPLPENCVIAALPSNLFWITDMTSDVNYMKIGLIANNRDDMFIKQVFSLFAHVQRQSNNVLYLG